MFKIFVTLLLTSTASFAFTDHDIMAKLIRPVEKMNSSITCTDFSGNWQGSCSSDSTSFKSKATIIQYKCSDLFINGRFHVIGAVMNRTTADMKNYSNFIAPNFSSSKKIDWVKKNTAIEFRTGGTLFTKDSLKPRNYELSELMFIAKDTLVRLIDFDGDKLTCKYSKAK